MSKVTKLSQYKGIEYSVEVQDVTEEEVQQQIQLVLSQSSSTVEKDGDTVENGDIATIDYCGKKDGVAFDGGTAQGYDLAIGSHTFIPGFEEQMLGMKVGETKDLHLSFPEQYHSAELAGQEVVFTVTVHKLSVPQEATLNDAFVKGLEIPQVETVEDFKAFLTQSMQAQKAQEAAAQKENMILDAFLESSVVEISGEDLDGALERQLAYMQNQMAQQGIGFDMYLQMTGMTLEQIKDQMKPSAMQQAKLEALIDKIIEVENLVVEDEVLNEQLEMVAQANQMTKEEVLERVDIEGFRQDLTRMMASRLIIDSAVSK